MTDAARPGAAQALRRLAVSVLLAPVIYALARVVGDLAATGWAETAVREAMLWALYGAAFWTALFLLLHPPVGLYVVGHELTHALFAWLQGVRVLRVNLHAGGGRIELARTNWLITLAPYFFPIYSLVILLVYMAAVQAWDQRALRLFWMALLGLSWGFHLTFTVRMLLRGQSDVEREGVVFSATVILAMNLLVVLLWLVCVVNHPWSEVAADFWRHLTAWLRVVAG